MALRPQAEKLLHIAKNVFAAKTFSKALGTESAELTFADQNQGVTFSMVVPDRICLPNPVGSGEPLLPVSSVIAIFDDLSTYSFLVKDRNCRSGVSVDLSAELLRDIPTGSTIHVVSHVSKLGKSIGFSDLHMYNEKNELVARGYHTKYLPMGAAWDIISHPAVLESTLKLYESVFLKYQDMPIGRALARLALGGHNKKIVLPEFLGVGSVFDAFGLHPITAQKSGILNKNKYRHTLEVVENNEFSFSVLPFMCNIRGFQHGGSVAMTIEGAINRSKTALDSQSRLSRMDIQYLNGMKRDLRITNENSILGKGEPNEKRICAGAILSSTDKICATYSGSWDSPK